MRFKSISHLLFVVIITTSIVITLPVISFASTQAVNDAAANTKLTNIYNRLGNMYDRMAATNAYLSNIQTYTNNSQAYEYDIRNTLINYFSPIAGDTINGSNRTISQQIYDLRQATYAVGGQTADVSSKLLTTNNYLSNIDSKTKDYTQYIDNIESEIHNLSWEQKSFTFGYYSSLDDAVAESNALTTSAQYPKVFVRINFTDYYPYNDLLKFAFPIIPYNAYYIPQHKFYIDNTYTVNNSNSGAHLVSNDNFYFEFYDMTNSSVSYIDGIGRSLSNGYNYRNVFIFEITSVSNIYVNTSNSPTCYIIRSDTEDYLKYKNYLKIQSFDIDGIESNLQTLVDVYASPDVIAAKQQQQAYEDQAITDFTGSGSAAASGSDTTNMKNVSGAIKSGLDSGGSVNGALGVFNTSSGLWDWFSQSNYDAINGPQTRSRGSDEYIDFYSINREELEELLGEYK